MRVESLQQAQLTAQPRSHGGEARLVHGRIVRVDEEDPTCQRRDLAQPAHWVVQMVENAQG
jgi:hypothetical protein